MCFYNLGRGGCQKQKTDNKQKIENHSVKGKLQNYSAV